MNNYFLLIAGDNYYPEGTDDWVNTFESKTQAESCIEITKEDILFLSGPRKGKVKETKEYYEYFKEGQWYKCDWYEIIDLREWTDKDRDPWLDTPLTPEERKTVEKLDIKNTQDF